MKSGEEFGQVADLYESINGDQGTLVYLVDRDQRNLAQQYKDIKSAKQIITAYAANNRHYLVILVGGIVKTKVKKNNKLIKQEK